MLVFLVILPFSSSSSSGTNSQARPSALKTAALEQDAFAKVNSYRASRGLPALEWNEVIAKQARQHSADMANGAASFGHDGIEDRVAAIRRRLALSGAAENVAMSKGYSDPAAAAVEDWLASPDHRADIEGDYDLTGIGTAAAHDGSVYFTQILVRSRAARRVSRR